MLGKLFLLFTITPIVETYLLVLLGQELGFWAAAALVLVTGVLGATLGKREGLKVWVAWREALAQGRMPEEGILGGVLVLVGGVLLVTPGVLTDVVGLSLLFPASRRVIARHVRRRLEAKLAEGKSRVTHRVRVEMPDGRVVERVEMRWGTGAASDPNVIDTVGEVVEDSVEPRRQLGEPER